MESTNSTKDTSTAARHILAAAGGDLDRALDLKEEWSADPETVWNGAEWAAIEDAIWEQAGRA